MHINGSAIVGGSSEDHRWRMGFVGAISLPTNRRFPGDRVRPVPECVVA
jgi:hypothetical protein